MMTHDFTYRLAVVAAVLVLLCSFFLWSDVKTQAYFASELASAHDTEIVTVDGATYNVVNGDVFRNGAAVSGLAAWRPRKLAFETAEARLSPFFGIAGVDPAALRAQTALLAQTVQRYVHAQSSATTSELLSSLYPISFLGSLADLEAARQQLVTYPTERSARSYELDVFATEREKARDFSAFRDAFVSVLPDRGFSILGYRGMLATNNQLRTIDALANDAAEVAERVRAQEDCLEGSYWKCESVTLSPVLSNAQAPQARNSPALETEVAHLWDDAYPDGAPIAASVRLSESACLGAVGAPYDIEVFEQSTNTSPILEFSYSGDIFFTPTDVTNTSPFLNYLRTNLGMGYTPKNPLKFYECPLVGTDIGRVDFVERTLAFAKAHPTIDPAGATKLLREDPTLESDAIAYINDAIAQSESSGSIADLHALDELSLMEKEKAGDLDQLVEDIAHIGDTDTSATLDHVMDVSAKGLFASHSAFPSFYHIGDDHDAAFSSFIIETPKLLEETAADAIPYSTLRSTVPRSQIVYDLRQFLIFEGRIAPATPSTTPAIKSPASSSSQP